MEFTKPNSGIVLRRGRRWGAASLAWAELTLEYATPLRPVHRAHNLDLLLWGDFVSWETPDGARVWAGPSDEIADLPIEEIYRDGEFIPGLALIWPLHHFIRVGPEPDLIEIVVGRFFPRGIFYAQRKNDLLIAPEYKAFSNVRSFKTIRPFPRGHRLQMNGSRSPIRFEPACETPGEPESYPPYEEACRQCRECIENALDESLLKLHEPYVLALSGGMDSSILAYLLAARDIRPPAYCVWFDCNRGEVPPEAIQARRVARDLNLDLGEVRVSPEMFRALAVEAIYLGEWPEAYQLDNAAYHVAFLRELTRLGIHVRVTGNGIDNAFAGYSLFENLTSPNEFRRLYYDLLSGAHTRHIASMNSFYGARSLAPFRTTPLLRFGLSLPRSYLTETRAGVFSGKRIVRDAFRGLVPDAVLNQAKFLPGQVNDAHGMSQELFGSREAYNRAYSAIRHGLFAFPDLRRMPAWALRAGIGRQMVERRRRAAERLLDSSIVRQALSGKSAD